MYSTQTMMRNCAVTPMQDNENKHQYNIKSHEKKVTTKQQAHSKQKQNNNDKMDKEEVQGNTSKKVENKNRHGFSKNCERPIHKKWKSILGILL